MGVFSWIQRVLFPPLPPSSRTYRPEAPSVQQHAENSLSPDEIPGPPPKREGTRSPAGAPQASKLMGPRSDPLDREDHLTVLLESPEEELLGRIGVRIDTGKFQIPLLPPTSAAALELANRPSVEVRQLVTALERDPVIASELLRMANSALFATQNPASSVQQAVMRIGLKSVRNVVFSAAMKSSLSNAKRLNEYAEEVWRQAQSVAGVSRALGVKVGFPGEQAHLIGLLHDLGKIALLGLLQREMKGLDSLSPALVGRAFHTFHERAGHAMAAEWKLPAEIVSVAGAHHDFAANTSHPREAALAKLAHELDLRMILHDEAGLRALVDSPALYALGVADEADRWRVIEAGRKQWEASQSDQSTGDDKG